MTDTKTKPDGPIPFRCKACGMIFVSQSQATFRCALCRCDKGSPILEEVNREVVTNAKTKPDGWVLQSGTGEILPHYFEDTKERCEARASNDFEEYAGEQEPFDCCVIPVCLVPPALLDWCKEVEEFLKKTLDHCILNGYGEIASEERDLLNKLKEVRG